MGGSSTIMPSPWRPIKKGFSPSCPRFLSSLGLSPRDYPHQGLAAGGRPIAFPEARAAALENLDRSRPLTQGGEHLTFEFRSTLGLRRTARVDRLKEILHKSMIRDIF